MARCEGITQSGEQCKLEARPGSRFCHLHQEDDEESRSGETQSQEAQELELEDFMPLLVAGAATLAFIVLFKSLGRLIPRL